MRRPIVHLVSQVGFQDRDILPHWFKYYRALGVEDIQLVLHGEWHHRQLLAWICRRHGAMIAGEIGGQFSTDAKGAALTKVVRRLRGDWVLLPDADEFVEFPFGSLAATVRGVAAFGMTVLPSIMVQRLADDGMLPPVRGDTNLWQSFPWAQTLLIERMTTRNDPHWEWKSKYPLFLAQADTVVRRGCHTAPDESGVDGFGLQAVTHHFKWRRNLLAALTLRAGNKNANGLTMSRVQKWLAEHGNQLPMEGAFLATRADLFRRGLLRRPGREEIALGALLHRVRIERGSGTVPRGLRSLLARLEGRWRDVVISSDAPPASGLASRAARVAIVTFEMPPPDHTGGLGTFVVAAAGALRRAGHAVTIVYAPLHKTSRFSPVDEDVWPSRGCAVKIVGMQNRDGTVDPSPDPAKEVFEHLVSGQFDIVHLPDAFGIGSLALAAKRQGHHLANTCFVVTAHGTSTWHEAGNRSPISEPGLRAGHMERLQTKAADVLITPSNYMRAWMRRENFPLPIRTISHPNPLPHSSWAGRKPRAPIAPIRRLAFFGRLEPRKGVDLFCDAIDQLADIMSDDLEIVFLGKLGDPRLAGYVEDRADAWRCRTSVISNWRSEDALLLLSQPETMAVLPSVADNSPYAVLECLGASIPFIATNIGGIPELIHPDDRSAALVPPEATALARALRKALTEGQPLIRPALNFATAELQWLAWHGVLLSENERPPVVAQNSDDPDGKIGRRADGMARQG